MVHYKRQQVLEILGVKDETLRYWREAFDPVKHRKTYSFGSILAFKILANLVRTHGISVKHLKKFDCETLFIWCDELGEKTPSDVVLVIDNKNFKFFFKPISDAYNQMDFKPSFVPLTHLIKDLKQSFFS